MEKGLITNIHEYYNNRKIIELLHQDSHYTIFCQTIFS